MSTPRKSVLITGCSAGGIGAGLAEAFHEKGYHVFVSARDTSKIPQSLSKAANITILALDVLIPGQIATAVERVGKETRDKLDVLVNNSGQIVVGPALDVSIEDSKKLFDINFWGHMAMLQAFAPLLINAKGCIVNNTSASAFVPMPFSSVYNASKAAFATASETWRLELQPLGVRTITLITLAVKTKIFVPRDGPPRFEIPQTSNYFGVRDFIYGLTDGHLQEGGLTTKQYATKVVREVEKGTVGELWVGGGAFTARWGWWLSPQFVRDMLVENFVPIAREMTKAVQGK